ncbi:LutC/YkgG family protein [Rufibacter ruber]|uniref:LutC/YkgG family protein n=1 Tax=Rufibacter ruber TaxID=1783499 RepID=UPI00082E848D|nr:LUD domain-containing protein [Rufibacter ruber]
MTSREKILRAVAQNQPALLPLPEVPPFQQDTSELSGRFTEVAVAIGARVFRVMDYGEVAQVLRQNFLPSHRIISAIPELAGFAEATPLQDAHRHQLATVDLAVAAAHFGVAENGAVWLTEEQMGVRVLPFITQHLAVVLPVKQILPLMPDAYARIGQAAYGYGVFMAGPSKTADIEQSLVLGAHGPRTMTVFLID